MHEVEQMLHPFDLAAAPEDVALGEELAFRTCLHPRPLGPPGDLRGFTCHGPTFSFTYECDVPLSSQKSEISAREMVGVAGKVVE